MSWEAKWLANGLSKQLVEMTLQLWLLLVITYTGLNTRKPVNYTLFRHLSVFNCCFFPQITRSTPGEEVTMVGLAC